MLATTHGSKCGILLCGVAYAPMFQDGRSRTNVITFAAFYTPIPALVRLFWPIYYVAYYILGGNRMYQSYNLFQLYIYYIYY